VGWNMIAASLLSSLNKIQGKKWLCWLTWIDGRHVFADIPFP
jgi:hypothetical protein